MNVRLLTDNGLLGMIEFHSNMKEPEIILLVTETFAQPVGLPSSDVSNGNLQICFSSTGWSRE